MKRAFIQARIDATMLQIAAMEDAALAFATNGNIQSYTIDTGQNRTVVVRANLTEIHKNIDKLYNRCATLEARLTGRNVVNVRPAW